MECALGLVKTCPSPATCEFHRWLSVGPAWHALGTPESNPKAEAACALPEARRLLKIFPPTKLKQQHGGVGINTSVAGTLR